MMDCLSYLGIFIIALVTTPIVRKLALFSGVTDKPNGDPLKIHEKPVALLGGLAIFITMGIGIWILGVQFSIFKISEKQVLGVILGGLLVFGIGLWDDIKGVKPIIRLLIQILAGIIVLLAGVRVNFIPILWITIPLTLFYIAGAINAFNVTDGMDGLCVGVSLISSVGFFFIGLRNKNIFLIVLSSTIFMSLLGFLPYNFHPAKIFLGDAGSGFLGFILGTMAVIVAFKPYIITNFIASILVIFIPVLDMSFAILRRLLLGKPLFVGDRDHVNYNANLTHVIM